AAVDPARASTGLAAPPGAVSSGEEGADAAAPELHAADGAAASDHARQSGQAGPPEAVAGDAAAGRYPERHPETTARHEEEPDPDGEVAARRGQRRRSPGRSPRVFSTAS